jgi:hypothetical protein
MVGLAIGEFPYFIDRLIGLIRMLLDVGLRLLLEVLELAHRILLCLAESGLPPDRAVGVPYPHAGWRCISTFMRSEDPLPASQSGRRA